MRIKLLILIFFLLLSCSLKKESKVSYEYKSDYWTDNFDEIKLVMSYVLSSEDYYKMVKMNDMEKIEFIDNYWMELDPNPNTQNNELLDELNSRVLESKQLFSNFDIGLLSDRAKIYIVYGPPNNEYKTYLDNYELITWYYESGYEFKFISDSFGQYKLSN